MSTSPFVSIVIPCRNESIYIGKCLDSIIASDFPKDCLEVLVVDGMSDDGSRLVLQEYSKRYAFIKVLENTKQITPAAFNMGISHARGELIMMMSAHATYSMDAIRKCVAYSSVYKADNVGGVWRIHPRQDSFIEKGIALALADRFGVGGALYRIGSRTEPTWVDTAAYGCYRRDVFERIGGFNEKLVRGQDMEFNLRLRRAGGRILLAPEVVVNYYARSDFRSFWKHNLRNGMWAVLPFLYTDEMPVSLRHLIPLFVVLTLISVGAVAALWPAAVWILLLLAGAYCLASLATSVRISVRQRDSRLVLVMPVLFASLHIGYGLGSVWGLTRIGGHTIAKLFRIQDSPNVGSS